MEVLVILVIICGLAILGASQKGSKSSELSNSQNAAQNNRCLPPARRTPLQRPVQNQKYPPIPKSMEITGKAYVIDGDTIIIKGTKIRLAGIDAPELDMPWGQKSKWAMVAICKGHTITAKLDGERSYDRLVGTCFLPDGRDIGAELIRTGLALDLPFFSGGKYRCIEPEGARRRLCNGKFGHASISSVRYTQVRVRKFQK